MSRLMISLLAAAGLATLPCCTRFGPVYPPRPLPSGGAPPADPDPARVVVHLAVGGQALGAAIDASAPRSGDGTVPLLGGDRRYTWERGAFDVAFSQGRVVLTTKANVTVDVPLKTLRVSLVVRMQGEPVVSSQYAVRLQAVDVSVTSTDTTVQIADRLAGVYHRIEEPLQARLAEFSYDLRPLLSEAYARVATPIPLPVGDAMGCARLKVVEVEAAPTVLADGIEKDIALVVAPSVTLPCAPDPGDGAATLPPLSNVAALTPGPFSVTVPIGARYDELARAMSAAFTNGRLYFSQEYPRIYLEEPEIYESQSELVLKLHLAGPVRGLGIDGDLDGDIYLAGHPTVVDNELAIPDLEPTIETRSLLLSLKALKDGDAIRDQARRALRLDIGERLRNVTARLGQDLTFRSGNACLRGDVDRIVVTGVYPHGSYLRLYVTGTARARATVPCDVPAEGEGKTASP